MSAFTYTVRVELHKVPHAEPIYQLLHAAMEIKGFSRTVTGLDGITYHLPPAEYLIETSLTWDKVLEMAKNAANTLMGDPAKSAVTISQSVGFWFNNLEPVLGSLVHPPNTSLSPPPPPAPRRASSATPPITPSAARRAAAPPTSELGANSSPFGKRLK